MSINLMTRLGELGKISKGLTPVVSVYLDTRWADEHQRDRGATNDFWRGDCDHGDRRAGHRQLGARSRQ